MDGYDLGSLYDGMIDIPDAVSKHFFLDFFCLFPELVEVVDVFLEILIKKFFCIFRHVPEGSLMVWGWLMTDCLTSSSDISSSDFHSSLLLLIKRYITIK